MLNHCSTCNCVVELNLLPQVLFMADTKLILLETFLKLNWLPGDERRDFNLLKLTFKALHAKQCMAFIFKVTERVYIKGTFQDTTAALINFLVNLKMCGDFNLFTSLIFMFLKNWAQASLS